MQKIEMIRVPNIVDEISHIIVDKKILKDKNINLLYEVKKQIMYIIGINDVIYNIHIDVGFQFDSSSIPRGLWLLASPFDKVFLLSGLVHDFLYRDLPENKNINRETADDIYLILLEHYLLFDMGYGKIYKKFAPILSYKSVRIAGKKYFKKINTLNLI